MSIKAPSPPKKDAFKFHKLLLYFELNVFLFGSHFLNS